MSADGAGGEFGGGRGVVRGYQVLIGDARRRAMVRAETGVTGLRHGRSHSVVLGYGLK